MTYVLLQSHPFNGFSYPNSVLLHLRETLIVCAPTMRVRSVKMALERSSPRYTDAVACVRRREEAPKTEHGSVIGMERVGDAEFGVGGEAKGT
ncbi:hypothetical protein CC86DRAFT_369694 [Ophiobolus disseminans]|uniref:Uncharacterized protein n=1 Tax=Ophiobolus disseminans TaxID=1469910 RepID=A0A6A7A2U2_9PLEO|nr:hypothetical protein CC86DRAFT_369694 [Ophiobolus disseminans]